VFSALQGGWVVVYDDETLEELRRFNVGKVRRLSTRSAQSRTSWCNRADVTCIP
jgi:hypothetical protein